MTSRTFEGFSKLAGLPVQAQDEELLGELALLVPQLVHRLFPDLRNLHLDLLFLYRNSS